MLLVNSYLHSTLIKTGTLIDISKIQPITIAKNETANLLKPSKKGALDQF